MGASLRGTEWRVDVIGGWDRLLSAPDGIWYDGRRRLLPELLSVV
jgi:hypothetical protein